MKEKIVYRDSNKKYYSKVLKRYYSCKKQIDVSKSCDLKMHRMNI